MVNLGRDSRAMKERVHCVDLLEMSLACAAELGYRLHEDSLGGRSGGVCELKGRKWLFLDPGQTPRERLHVVIDALAADPAVHAANLPPQLKRVILTRRAA
jgi:hypothetical protein